MRQVVDRVIEREATACNDSLVQMIAFHYADIGV